MKTISFPSLKPALERINYELIMDFEEHHPRVYIHLEWNSKEYKKDPRYEFPEGGLLFINVPTWEWMDFINGIQPPEMEIRDFRIEFICFPEDRRKTETASRFCIRYPAYPEPMVYLTRF